MRVYLNPNGGKKAFIAEDPHKPIKPKECSLLQERLACQKALLFSAAELVKLRKGVGIRRLSNMKRTKISLGFH